MLLRNIPIFALRMWEDWQAQAYHDINFINPMWLVIVYTDALTLAHWEEETQIDV